MRRRRKIATYLWFDREAEEAARLYVSLFERARIVGVTRRRDGGSTAPGGASGAVMVVFEIDGQRLMALNGGPHFAFNEAISLYVDCETQDEIDRLWVALTADGGAPGRCGWLKDRFGVSWQIVPTVLGELLQDADGERARRVTDAMLAMDKLDIARLVEAHRGP